MSDLVEKTFYDESSDKLIVQTAYNNSAVVALNTQQRNAAPETGRYKGNLVHVGRIHMGDVIRLKNEGYDLLSADPEEAKRALLYIQSNERAHLTMPGTPIGKKKQSWA